MFFKIFFLMSVLLTVGSAIAVLVTKNLMHSCVYLLFSLLGMAGLYLTLSADFVAATQIMVYMGGIVILMLFAVMLTGGKDFVSKTQALLGLAPTMGNRWTLFFGLLTATVFSVTGVSLILKLKGFIKIDEVVGFNSTLEELGNLLVTDHILAFEISSVLLVGSLVGAAIIARPDREVRHD